MARRIAILKNSSLVIVLMYREDTQSEERAELVAKFDGDDSIILEETQEIKDDGTVIENVKPFPSWVWHSEGRVWKAPKEQPIGDYEWSEESQDWELWSAS